jgi:hypothetical protein
MSDETYGVGLDVTIGADYVLRLPYGENGVTFYVIRPTSAGLSARLPLGPFCRKGDKIVIANHGAHSLAVRDVFTTLIATVAAGTTQSFWLIDAVPLGGTWVTRNVSSSIGATLVHDREELLVVLSTWVGNGINLRSYCNTALGYTGSKPAAVYCQLTGSIVIGSELVAEPSFDTGTWPAGSTLLLEIGTGSSILGKGGRGGAGGDVPPGLLSQPGALGGDALVVRLDTGLINHGTISGGGGGGGGGGAVVGQGGGGGGGGGAGYITQTGGLGGAGGLTSPAGNPGASGSIGVGGAGGNGGSGSAGPGGAGGGPGANGSAGTNGAAGGVAGNATKRLTSVALNLIVAGTINGPQVTF